MPFSYPQSTYPYHIIPISTIQNPQFQAIYTANQGKIHSRAVFNLNQIYDVLVFVCLMDDWTLGIWSASVWLFVLSRQTLNKRFSLMSFLKKYLLFDLACVVFVLHCLQIKSWSINGTDGYGGWSTASIPWQCIQYLMKAFAIPRHAWTPPTSDNYANQQALFEHCRVGPQIQRLSNQQNTPDPTGPIVSSQCLVYVMP